MEKNKYLNLSKELPSLDETPIFHMRACTNLPREYDQTPILFGKIN